MTECTYCFQMIDYFHPNRSTIVYVRICYGRAGNPTNTFLYELGTRWAKSHQMLFDCFALIFFLNVCLFEPLEFYWSSLEDDIGQMGRPFGYHRLPFGLVFWHVSSLLAFTYFAFLGSVPLHGVFSWILHLSSPQMPKHILNWPQFAKIRA